MYLLIFAVKVLSDFSTPNKEDVRNSPPDSISQNDTLNNTTNSSNLNSTNSTTNYTIVDDSP